MTPADLHALSKLSAFPASAAELIHVAGLDAAARLIAAWPGQEFPVPAAPGGLTESGAKKWMRLVEVVGAMAASKIVRHWSRGILYIPNLEEVRMMLKKDELRAEFDQLTAAGKSTPDAVFELGVKHRITGRAVRSLLKRPDNFSRGEAAPQQPDLLAALNEIPLREPLPQAVAPLQKIS